jgi:hypothetical protein
LVVVEGLIFAGCEHPEGAVAALAVVEDLEVLKDRVGEGRIKKQGRGWYSVPVVA